MIETKQPAPEKAILVALRTRNITIETVEEHLTELEMLAETAGAASIMKVVQVREKIDSAFYIGKGKAEELLQLVEQNEVNLIIFDDDLSPVQVRNLEKLLNKKIVDRSGLILDIFASRAKTKEAKTQVELAQLQYMLPRLTRAWTHLSKQYGGIGTKGPGETQIETDRRIIRTRISHLKEKLVKIESQRQTQSAGRSEFTRVSLVGYTNAGKSTLFNRLTNSGVLAENKLFATLDSTTRAYDVSKTSKILISDTVGFIRKLPAHLVASFKTTLNEVRDSDIILHLIDASNPYYEEHIRVVDETLKELGAEKKQIIKIFNKVDLITDKSFIDFILGKYENTVFVSAERGMGITQLLKEIETVIGNSYVKESIELNINESEIVSKIHSLAKVLSTKYDDEVIKIQYRASKENAEKIKRIINEKKKINR